MIIDPEIKALIPTLKPDERAKLRESIKNEGCRDPLVIWKGHDILLDGHNRYEICQELGQTFQVVEREFPDKDRAMLWILKNQLGRRNLSEIQFMLLVGREYELIVQINKRVRHEKHQRVQKLRAAKCLTLSRRECCYICGGWAGLTERHHVLPIGVYVDLIDIPETQVTVNLCPNHHALIHALEKTPLPDEILVLIGKMSLTERENLKILDRMRSELAVGTSVATVLAKIKHSLAGGF